MAVFPLEGLKLVLRQAAQQHLGPGYQAAFPLEDLKPIS